MRAMIAVIVGGMAGLGGLGHMAWAEMPNDAAFPQAVTIPADASVVQLPLAIVHPHSTSASPYAPIPQGSAAAAASIAPYTPADRNEHLRQAAEHLQAAGLGALADHVRSLAALPAPGAPPAPHSARQDPQQVLLAVKVLDINAGKLDRLGLGLHLENDVLHGNFVAVGSGAGGPRNTVGVMTDPGLPARIDALRKDCLVQVLAEPTLVTVINTPSSFFSGRQLAVPTTDGPGDTKPEYKNVGTQLDFVPTILGNGRLRLELHCKFSELDPTHSVAVHGFVVPGIGTHEVETGVEMEPGQTLVAAFPPLVAPADSKSQRPAVRLVLVTPELVASPAVGSSAVPTMAPPAAAHVAPQMPVIVVPPQQLAAPSNRAPQR